MTNKQQKREEARGSEGGQSPIVVQSAEPPPMHKFRSLTRRLLKVSREQVLLEEEKWKSARGKRTSDQP
jgi:hypothetical protein